ncbi:hypothetical protein CRYPA_143 [uncultured Candidatus Thioglobus sp.]|nr:hypothetical protein CRYPA_143 [uncultured Candidatus Thioglobus sp.]
MTLKKIGLQAKNKHTGVSIKNGNRIELIITFNLDLIR